MNSNRTKSKVHIRGVDISGSDQDTPEKNDELSETFLLGNISDLLYEIKCLAKSTSAGRSLRIKRRSIEKLKQVLERYRNLLGHHFKEIISEFIRETFKSQKVSRHDLRKIQAWWLKDALKINN